MFCDELGGGALDGRAPRPELARRLDGAGGAPAADGGRGTRRRGLGSWRRGAAARSPAGRLAHDAALEQAPPLRVHRRGVAEELLVHRLREAGIGRLEHIRIHGLLSW